MSTRKDDLVRSIVERARQNPKFIELIEAAILRRREEHQKRIQKDCALIESFKEIKDLILNPSSEESIAMACSFLSKLTTDSSYPDGIYPTQDRGIQFEYDQEGSHVASILFTKEGKIEAYFA